MYEYVEKKGRYLPKCRLPIRHPPPSPTATPIPVHDTSYSISKRKIHDYARLSLVQRTIIPCI